MQALQLELEELAKALETQQQQVHTCIGNDIIVCMHIIIMLLVQSYYRLMLVLQVLRRRVSKLKRMAKLMQKLR